jgi:hypothetical protein
MEEGWKKGRNRGLIRKNVNKYYNSVQLKEDGNPRTVSSHLISIC